MPNFHYQARNASGQRTTGTLQAGSRQEALAWLAEQSLITLRLESRPDKKSFFSNVAGKHKVAMYSLLADLLESGVPLVKSLNILVEQTSNPKLNAILSDLTARVSDGSSLAIAMQGHKDIFGDLAISMVHAGEEGGFLEDSLKRVADFTEKQDALKGKVLGALAYPLFLLLIGAFVVTGMILFFVPKFAPMFDRLEARGELPTATVLLLALSEFARTYWGPCLGGGACFLFVGMKFLRTPQGREFTDGLKLKFGLFGTIYRNLAIARFCRALGTLLKSGVPLVQSLNIAREATANRVLNVAIANVSENVQSGKSLVAPLAACQQFPTEVLEMIHVGEQSNRLETLLVDIADKLEVRTQRKLDVFVKLIEPSLMLVMATIIGFLVVALLLPVFESSGSIG